MTYKGLSAPQILPISVPRLKPAISHADPVLLIGSCFTEHISGRLATHKFSVLQNPHGILFNPVSVARSLESYADEKQYLQEDLFQLNDIWNSWAHHSSFSDIDRNRALESINASQQAAAAFIRRARWIVITLGSAFLYRHKESGDYVSNNHRGPAAWFQKELLPIAEITAVLQTAMGKVRAVNPDVNFLFTISPVRHVRDGVIENNRSKARLLEAVHELCDRLPEAHYFPAYEIVIDVLRDYRYYDLDMVHPNYSATSMVWEEFVKSCIDPAALRPMEAVKEISIARSHRPRFPDTPGHQKFLAGYAEKIKALQEQYPYLNLDEELAYFQHKS